MLHYERESIIHTGPALVDVLNSPKSAVNLCAFKKTIVRFAHAKDFASRMLNPYEKLVILCRILCHQHLESCMTRGDTRNRLHILHRFLVIWATAAHACP